MGDNPPKNGFAIRCGAESLRSDPGHSFQVLEGECLPGNVGIGFAVVEDVDDVHQEREIPQIDQTELGFATDGIAMMRVITRLSSVMPASASVT